MLLVDANVLVYAVNEDAALHTPAHRWLDEALSGEETIGFAWIVTLAFVRLTTAAAIFPQPLGVDQAFDVVESWMGRPAAVVVEPTSRHVTFLRGLLASSGAAGNLVNDAHLAALAIEHRAGIASFDRDFTRFGDIEVVVPA